MRRFCRNMSCNAVIKSVRVDLVTLTCVTGAFIALAPDQALKATVKAFATFSAAGAIAGHQAKGPGSFVPLFIDALAEMDDQMVDRSVSIRPW
ncbi:MULTISPECIES: hydroxyethylthiazole kinase, partial [Bartonella]|uniref:hydroxyethylthiazole kinase n=1 Tax=Bartonella TaxID=773 RepID=UPI0034E59FDD